MSVTSLNGNINTLRTKAFPIISGILTVVLLIAGSFEFIPAWILRDPADDIHLWHIAELAAIAIILLGIPMFSLIRRSQEKPVLAQFIILSTVILAVGIMPFEIKAAGLLLISAIFAITYPNPRALLSFKHEGRVSIVLLGLSLVLAVLLAPIAWREVQWQIIGMSGADAHAQQLHWIGSALLMVMLVVAGILSATKQRGWRELAFITGEAYIYLGIIAMIVPDYAGSWGNTGGFFAIFAGIFYILITLAEIQGAPKPVTLQQTSEELTNETVPVQEALKSAEADEALLATTAR